MYNKKQTQKPMIEEDLIDEFETMQTTAMAKLEAYKKVVASIKRMHASSERKLKGAKVALERAEGVGGSGSKLLQKVLEAQAATEAYTEVCILVAKVAKEYKDTMMREVGEFNKIMGSS